MASPALADDVQTTTTVLIANSDSVADGDEVTLTATVAPAAEGSVEFFNGTTSLGTAVTYDAATGVATLTTTALPVGTNSVTAKFTSDNETAFTSSTSNEVTVTVAAITRTNLDASETSLTDGDEVTLTATVAPAAEGSVEFFNGTTSLGTADTYDAETGVATLSTYALPFGINPVTATFTPSDLYAFKPSTSDALSVTVRWMPTVVVDVDPTSVTEGGEVTLTATVTTATEGPAVEGTVEFFGLGDSSVRTATIHNGVATLLTDAPPVGTYYVYAWFTPPDDTTFFRTSSYDVLLTVNEATTDDVTDDGTEGDEESSVADSDEESSETDTLPQTGDSLAPVAALTLVAATTLTAGVSFALVGRTKAHRKF